MKASAALNVEMDWRGQPPIHDAEISTDCEQCGKATNLGACRNTTTDQGLVYRCHSCPEVLLIVAAFGDQTQPWPGRGYRIGNWVLRNVGELRFRNILIPASPNAAIDEPLEG